MLDPMYEFFASANPDLPPECVPTEAVIIFLDDKTALPISQALERLLYRQELRTLTRLKLVEVIDEVIAGIEAEGGDQRMESPEPPAALRVVSVPEHTPEPIPELIPEPTPEPVPEPTPEPTAEPTPELTPELTIERTPATIVASRRQRLEQVMDARTREKVVKKLFRDDQVRFDAVVEAVLTQASWKDAASALDRLYAQFGIEPNSAPAMELSQALFASYQT
jgi:outer membrane biosynthesis protein TonB